MAHAGLPIDDATPGQRPVAGDEADAPARHGDRATRYARRGIRDDRWSVDHPV
ncbi:MULTISPECIES: hypothetical protein [unclassified Pseudonocardia]|uniref:hypothetical protein n=1 Tax=unclassified Pseudonocardia TaxID=2619320 RepID=UPI00030AAB29|nr:MULTISPECIES: hypothetical protein [unclassified Pseudonocardia]OLM32925.1 hypothetical protein Ae717Ps2_3821 [Pseudonocardia sp. Ae717_Ps2]